MGVGAVSLVVGILERGGTGPKVREENGQVCKGKGRADLQKQSQEDKQADSQEGEAHPAETEGMAQTDWVGAVGGGRQAEGIGQSRVESAAS